MKRSVHVGQVTPFTQWLEGQQRQAVEANKPHQASYQGRTYRFDELGVFFPVKGK